MTLGIQEMRAKTCDSEGSLPVGGRVETPTDPTRKDAIEHITLLVCGPGRRLPVQRHCWLLTGV